MKAFTELNRDELLQLYIKFVAYRDEECNGLAKMSVQEFYMKRFSK
jgi:hypothetical protein